MNQNLVAVAKDNMVRISPNKLSILVNSIVNMKVSTAINQLYFIKKYLKLLAVESAVANAENNKQLDIDKLFVKEAQGKVKNEKMEA